MRVSEVSVRRGWAPRIAYAPRPPNHNPPDRIHPDPPATTRHAAPTDANPDARGARHPRGGGGLGSPPTGRGAGGSNGGLGWGLPPALPCVSEWRAGTETRAWTPWISQHPGLPRGRGWGQVRGGVRGQGESARVQREGHESENSAPFAEDLIPRTRCLLT